MYVIIFLFKYFQNNFSYWSKFNTHSNVTTNTIKLRKNNYNNKTVNPKNLN